MNIAFQRPSLLLKLLLLASCLLGLARAGNYQLSCFNISIDANGFLNATCYNAIGLPNSTSINLNSYISDNLGVLNWSSNGGFFCNCRYVRLDPDNHTLRALCSVYNSVFIPASIDLAVHIDNTNGSLVYKA